MGRTGAGALENLDCLTFDLLGLALCVSVWCTFSLKHTWVIWLIVSIVLCLQLSHYGKSFQEVFFAREELVAESEDTDKESWTTVEELTKNMSKLKMEHTVSNDTHDEARYTVLTTVWWVAAITGLFCFIPIAIGIALGMI